MARTHSFSNGRVVVGFLVALALYLLLAPGAVGASVATIDHGGMRFRDHDGTYASTAGKVTDGTSDTGTARVSDGTPAASLSGRESVGTSSGLVLSRPNVDPVEIASEQPVEAPASSLLERAFGFLVVLVVLYWTLNETAQRSEGPSRVAYHFRRFVRRLAV